MKKERTWTEDGLRAAFDIVQKWLDADGHIEAPLTVEKVTDAVILVANVASEHLEAMIKRRHITQAAAKARWDRLDPAERSKEMSHRRHKIKSSELT